MDKLAMLQQHDVPFVKWLGIRFVSADAQHITAEMTVRDDLCNGADVLHGGALMAFADTLGGYATELNLPEGAGTTTVESKTNFLAPAPLRTKIMGECQALHRGRRTMVWQTRVRSEDGRLIAVVTQTQLVLERPRSAPLQLASNSEGKSIAEQKARLALIERDSAVLYRQLATAESDPNERDKLLRTAAAHEEQARLLTP